MWIQIEDEGFLDYLLMIGEIEEVIKVRSDVTREISKKNEVNKVSKEGRKRWKQEGNKGNNR